MRLHAINKYLRWFGVVLVVEIGDWIVLRLERASKHPLELSKCAPSDAIPRKS